MIGILQRRRPPGRERGGRGPGALLRLTAVLAGLAAASGCQSDAPLLPGPDPEPPTTPPNVLLVTADDLGPMLGAYGDPVAHTPHLDRLATQGVRFQNAYVTQASCSPSRSSLLTGLYPHQNGQMGLVGNAVYSMRPGVRTLPDLLAAAGYRTGILGKLHVAPDTAFPFDLKATNHEATRRVAETATRALAFMREAGDRPFLLMVSFSDPHVPFQPQVEGVPPRPLGAGDVRPWAFQGGLDTPAARARIAGYYNGVARVDAGVGLLLQGLQQSGLADNTMVIFLGDHGPPFARAKTSNYEAGVRIPLLVYDPRANRAGSVRTELVSTVDIVPTVLEAAGLEAPPGLEGRSLRPLLRGDEGPWREALFTEHTAHQPGTEFPRRTVRDGRYKLILNLAAPRANPLPSIDGDAAPNAAERPEYDGTLIRRIFNRHHRPPRVELYDLLEDPHEYQNLAGSPEHQEIRERLEGQLAEWRQRTGDPLPH